MKMNRRISLIIILLGLALVLGILFRSFVLEDIIKPVALVLWIFRRVFLSVNQEIYWGLLIFAALVAALLRLPRSSPDQKVLPAPDSNATLKEISSWRASIWLTGNEIDQFNILKQNLGWTLASLYASDLPEKALWEIYDALEHRSISIPKPIYDFLFPDKPPTGKPSIRQILRTVRGAPIKWVRRWTGRDVAEYHQSIEAVLAFMESLKETQNDDRHFDPTIH